jgi:hypothetical protein
VTIQKKEGDAEGRKQKRQRKLTSIAKNWTLVTRMVLSSAYNFSASFLIRVPKL